MSKPSGLGKGLSALIPGDVATEDRDSSLREIDIDDLVANRYQPREHFDEERLESLTASVREVGVLQPVLVREQSDGQYELIAGERRWRAARRAGLATIPAIVRPADDKTSLEHAVVENLHRQDLNALEEAAAYQQLVDDFGLTQEQVAHRVGKSRSAISNTLRLFQLPPSVQKLVADDQLSPGHARAILGTPDRAEQERLARRVVADGMNVREVEEYVRRLVEADDPEPEDADADAGSTASAVDSARREPGQARDAGLLELEELLSTHLDTRVHVSLGAKIGRITIDFADLDDLERLYRIIV